MDKHLYRNLAFMLSLREALSLGVSVNNEDINEQNQLKTKFLKTATDYEILNYVIEGKFPKEKQNLIQENILLDEIKIIIDSSFEILEVLGESETKKLVESLHPLSESNLSSSSIILDFLMENNANRILNNYLDIPEQKEIDPNKLIINRPQREAIPPKPRPQRKPPKYKIHLRKGRLIRATIYSAMLLYFAYQLFKKYLNKTKESCEKYKGKEKVECLKKLRNMLKRNNVYFQDENIKNSVNITETQPLNELKIPTLSEMCISIPFYKLIHGRDYPFSAGSVTTLLKASG